MPLCTLRRAHGTRRAKQEAADLGEHKHFALKALAKKAVIDRGQLAHVKDEKLLLQNMIHPLILQLFSTFQVHAFVFFSIFFGVCFSFPPLFCSGTWRRRIRSVLHSITPSQFVFLFFLQALHSVKLVTTAAMQAAWQRRTRPAGLYDMFRSPAGGKASRTLILLWEKRYSSNTRQRTRHFLFVRHGRIAFTSLTLPPPPS